MFDAALKDPNLQTASAPKPAFPTFLLEIPAQAVLHPHNVPSPFPVHTVMPAAAGPQAPLPQVFDAVKVPATAVGKMPTMSAVLVGISGGDTLWLVQNPDRVAAFKDVMKDFRSVGDVKSLVANVRQPASIRMALGVGRDRSFGRSCERGENEKADESRNDPTSAFHSYLFRSDGLEVHHCLFLQRLRRSARPSSLGLRRNNVVNARIPQM